MKQYYFILFLVISFTIKAQWNIPTVNTPLCLAPDKQSDPRMLENGHGGSYVAWKDFRNGGVPDIYIQRIDKDGYVLWQTDGVPLCSDPADQSTPSITTDNHKGAIVAWSDWRSGIERDIYAQRIDSNGNVLWTTDGAIVTDKTVREHNEKAASDGLGGAYIFWEEQSGGGWDIWGQHLDSNGVRMWGNGGIPATLVSGNKINVKLQRDGKGGIILAWQDFRNGLNYDIYAQRFDAAGNRLWGDSAVSVCSVNGSQYNVKIDPDSIGKGIYLTWVDDRNGNSDIYAQRIDSTGKKYWPLGGIAVCNNIADQSAEDVASSGSLGGGMIVAWKDKRNGNIDIYAQKLNKNGVSQWTNGGIPICSSPQTQLNPNIIADGLGGAIIAWQDSAYGMWDIKSQKVNSAGNVLWTTDGVDVSVAPNEQTGPKNITDDEGGSIYVWEDKRSGTKDLYIHRITDIGYNVSLAPEKNPFSVAFYPNPVGNQFYCEYQIQQESEVNIQLLNSLGQTVTTLLAEREISGKYTHQFEIGKWNLPSGLYYLRIIGEGKSAIFKCWKI